MDKSQTNESQTNTWLEFWSAKDNPIYCCDKHLHAHYMGITQDILSHLPPNKGTVLDFGCGYALFAPAIAALSEKLILVEDSQSINAQLKAANSQDNIEIITSNELKSIRNNSLDLTIINSVLQYLDDETRHNILSILAQKLKRGGKLIVADVLPPKQSMLKDISSLLSFAFKNGFFFAAIMSLAKIKFSSYAKIRSSLGLKTFSEQDIITELSSYGLNVTRLPKNFGHNQTRMAFACIKP